MTPFNDALRTWRRKLKARMPYVRRREHDILQRQYSALIEGLGWTAGPAAQAHVQALKPIVTPLAGEVCLFVSHVPQPQLKAHVRAHVTHLLDAGVQVVLVLNSDLAPAAIELEGDLLRRLSGVLVRENLGFDFAAWAHSYGLCGDTGGWTRLFLVNDSIIGPLNDAAFTRVLARVRRSQADLVGLTESCWPVRHLQSFFLVLNASALRSAAVQQVFERMLNLPTKDLVVDIYETRLTHMLSAQGLSCEALFAPLSGDPHTANDTHFRWEQLIRSGFPYIKASVVREFGEAVRATALLPADLIPIELPPGR